MEEIQSFCKAIKTPRLAAYDCAGGVLGESIDFIEFPIEGVFVVSIGLPPKSIERDLLAGSFCETARS